MFKWATTVIGVLAFLYVGNIAVHLTLGKRLMDHMNDCHTELHIGERLKSGDEQERSKAYDEYGQCVIDNSAFFDKWYFGKDVIAKLMDEMKQSDAKKMRAGQ
jgi:hypothetical protein